MILLEPNPTPFDLRWRMFGTGVRVHPLFWLIMAVFGFHYFQQPVLAGSNGVLELLLWVFCCFVSILLHEFGHIWAGQAFGSNGHIVLHGFGGLAIGASGSPVRWQRIVVSAAGPAIQLALWAFLYFMAFGPAAPVDIRAFPPAVILFLTMLLFVNLFWPIFNLLPIYPLDGGQICRELCCAVQGGRGTITSLWISVILAASLAVYAFLGRSDAFVGLIRDLPDGPVRDLVRLLFGFIPTGTYNGLFFAMMAFNSWQMLQYEQQARSYRDDDRLPWE